MTDLIASFIVLPALVFAVVMAVKTHRINKETGAIIEDTKRLNLDTAERWERAAELRAELGDVQGARAATSLSRAYRAMTEGS